MEQSAQEGKNILGLDRLYDTERYGKEKKGDFAKSKFRYETENNCYICPGNCHLELQRMIKTKTSPLVSEYYNIEACAGCILAQECLSKDMLYRGYTVIIVNSFVRTCVKS